MAKSTLWLVAVKGKGVALPIAFEGREQARYVGTIVALTLKWAMPGKTPQIDLMEIAVCGDQPAQEGEKWQEGMWRTDEFGRC